MKLLASTTDALAFADRIEPERVLLFHHDPLHKDRFIEQLAGDVRARVEELGRGSDWASFATERQEIVVGAQPAPALDG